MDSPTVKVQPVAASYQLSDHQVSRMEPSDVTSESCKAKGGFFIIK